MKITSSLKAKNLSEATVGELVYVSRSTGRLLCLVMRQRNDKSVVGVLEYGEMKANGPFHMTISGNKPCLSYGTSWVLQPLIGSETLPGSRQFAFSAGALHFDNTGLKMMFVQHPEDYENSEISFNLDSGEFEEASSMAAPCASWRIWANENDLLRPSATAVFDFIAAPGV